MATTKIDTRIVLKNDSPANWLASTIIPMKGEACIEINDTGASRVKYGDGVHKFSELAFEALTQAEISALIKNGAVQTVSIAKGPSNGQISLTVDGATTNVGVTGLGNAAYTDPSAYATAAQGKNADNAMPKAGGTFTGAVTLKANPTAALHPATKQYVDDQIIEKLKASDAMVFKGTLGTNGAVTAIPTTDVVLGDTYKVITAGNYAGYACKIGDLLVALASGSVTAATTNWCYIPSGDERETLIRVAASGVNVNANLQAGSITLGMAAAKQVDTAISAASTSESLPTSKAVAAFVEGKSYVTTDNKVLNTLAATKKAYITGTESAATNTGGQVFDTGVYLGTAAGSLYAATFNGYLEGNAGSANKWLAGRKITLGGNLTGSVTIDGSQDVVLNAAVNNNSHTHTSANITDAVSTNTANTIVKRDANGNFSAGTITANLTGTAAKATTADKLTSAKSFVFGKSSKTSTLENGLSFTLDEMDASPKAGSTALSQLASTIRLGNGDNGSIYQNGSSYQQKINIIDNSTAGDAVFEFAQSTNSGTSFTNLMAIRDDGNIVANSFTGIVSTDYFRNGNNTLILDCGTAS